MAGLSDRKHYATPVSHSKIRPKQCCWRCRKEIREQEWWRLTNTAYFYRDYIYCGACLHKKNIAVRDDEGNVYYTVIPKLLRDKVY